MSLLPRRGLGLRSFFSPDRIRECSQHHVDWNDFHWPLRKFPRFFALIFMFSLGLQTSKLIKISCLDQTSQLRTPVLALEKKPLSFKGTNIPN